MVIKPTAVFVHMPVALKLCHHATVNAVLILLAENLSCILHGLLITTVSACDNALTFAFLSLFFLSFFFFAFSNWFYRKTVKRFWSDSTSQKMPRLLKHINQKNSDNERSFATEKNIHS